MIPLIFTALDLAIFLFGTVFIGLTAVKFKSIGGNKQINVLTKEYRDQLISAYNKAFAAFNLDAMHDMLTEYMHYTTENTLKVLKKLGLKKEVTFTPDPEFERVNANTPFNIIQNDGKNDFTLSTMQGEYTEKFYDADTMKVIFSRTRKTDYTIDFLKSNDNLADTPHNCINCGCELTLNGNILDCDSCGTHYQAENYKWNISDIQVGTNESNPWVKPVLFAGLGVLIASALSMLIQSTVFTSILIAIDVVGLLLALKYLTYVKGGIDTIKAMEQKDPNASRMTFYKRVNYLVRTLEMAKDFNIKDARPFMTEDAYNELKQTNEIDDYYVVDMDIKKMYPSNYRIENNKQFVDVELTIDRLMINPKKKIKQKTVKSKHTLCKHINAKTISHSCAQAVICPNCNASINLIKDTQCPYCDTPIDVSMSDWIISQ